MKKYKIQGLMFHKKTDSKSSFCEYTAAESGKKAFNNIRFRLKDYYLRDVEVIPLCEIKEKPFQQILLGL